MCNKGRCSSATLLPWGTLAQALDTAPETAPLDPAVHLPALYIVVYKEYRYMNKAPATRWPQESESLESQFQTNWTLRSMDKLRPKAKLMCVGGPSEGLPRLRVGWVPRKLRCWIAGSGFSFVFLSNNL